MYYAYVYIFKHKSCTLKIFQLKVLNLKGSNLGKLLLLLGTIMANLNIFDYMIPKFIHTKLSY